MFVLVCCSRLRLPVPRYPAYPSPPQTWQLRQRGLPVSGSTPQLQARLLKCVEAEETKAAAKAAKKAAKAQAKAEAKAAAKAAKLEQKQGVRDEALAAQSPTDKAP